MPLMSRASFNSPRRATNLAHKAPPSVAGIGRRPKTTAAIAKLALAIAKRSATDVEPKVQAINTTYQDMFGALTGFVSLLTNMSQGDQINQRAGVRVNMKRIDVRMKVSSWTNSNLTYRVLVVQALDQVVATPPAVTDIIYAPNSVSHYNSQQRDKFKILYDKVHELGPRINFAGQDQTKTISFSVKNFARNGLVEWTDGTGTNISKNGVYLIVTAEYAAPGDNLTAVANGETGLTALALAYYTDQ